MSLLHLSDLGVELSRMVLSSITEGWGPVSRIPDRAELIRRAEEDPTQTHRRDWILLRLESQVALRTRLMNYASNGRWEDSGAMLSCDDFSRLLQVVYDMPHLCLDCWWERDRDLDGYIVAATHDICESFSRPDAEAWAEKAHGWATTLRSRQPLADAIDIVWSWTERIRWYLELSKSARSGDGSPSSDPWTDDQFRMMRDRVRESPKSRFAKPYTPLPQINHHVGRLILRRLEKLGEYEGFARPKSARYKRTQ